MGASTVDQVAGLEAQEAALAATGCTKLFAEQASSVGQRDQLDAALDFVHEGDALTAAARLNKADRGGGPFNRGFLSFASALEAALDASGKPRPPSRVRTRVRILSTHHATCYR